MSKTMVNVKSQARATESVTKFNLKCNIVKMQQKKTNLKKVFNDKIQPDQIILTN